jgi:hypothetical protein
MGSVVRTILRGDTVAIDGNPLHNMIGEFVSRSGKDG